MPFESPEPPKKNSSLQDALESGIVIFAVPILLGFFAQAFLPLQRIASFAPASLRSYLTDGKSVGALIFAVGVAVVWPVMTWRMRRTRDGYHPKGTYQPGRINIWVAELEGDSAKHEARRRMVASLDELFRGSVAILLADIQPRLEDTGVVGEEAEEGNRAAQEYLDANQGELILWGQYFKEPAPMMELRLVSVAQDGRQAVPFEYDTTIYRPAEKKFRPYFAAALAALVARMAQQPEEDYARYIGDVLRPLARKIAPLAQNLPHDMGYEQRARIFHGLGDLYLSLGEQGSSSSELRLGIRMLLRARCCWRRAKESSQQSAKTMEMLALTYWVLGEKSPGTIYVELSLRASSAALAATNPENDFASWARSKLNQATALDILGLRTGSRSHLEKGISEANAVLQRPEVADFPRLESGARDSIATLYLTLGTLVASPESLKLGLASYRELLTFWTRETDPLDWARTQMNMGAVLCELWDFDSRKELLEEAWTACELALTIYSPVCVPAYCGKARCIMGDIFYKQRQFKDAADLYVEALKLLSPDTDEFQYGRAREWLDSAYTQMSGGYLVGVTGSKSGPDSLERGAR